MKFIIGKKLEMSQIFEGEEVIPVTLVEAGPCVVTEVKKKEKDGYSSVQIGYEKKKENKIRKSEKGRGYKHLKEFRCDNSELKIGDEINVSVFKEGDIVRVSGISKGKGFQGAVKRWGFHGQSRTHGIKHDHRTLGSVGATGPARVFLGKKMPGHMGAERVSVKNLKVVKIDKENNLIAIKGAIPGHKDTLIEVITQFKHES